MKSHRQFFLVSLIVITTTLFFSHSIKAEDNQHINELRNNRAVPGCQK